MKPPAGFSPIVDLPFEIGAKRPLFSTANTALKLFGNTKAKSLWGIVRFDEAFTGPPGHVHGGAQAYVLDEAMGTVCWNSNVPVVAKTIEIGFKKPVPLHQDLILTAEVGRKAGTHVIVKSAIRHNGEILATGSGRFYILTYKRIATMLGGKTPKNLSRWFPE